MPYKRLSQLIETHFDGLSKELRKAARWVREHPAELGLQSLRQSAAAAGVSPATMSRLPRALGMSSYEEMRRPSMVAFAQTMGLNMDLGMPSEPKEPARTQWLGELRNCQSANSASVYLRNNRADFEQAAQLIVQARSVVFLGLRSSFSIAFHMQYTCDWLRAGTHLASDTGGAWPEKVMGMDANDVLVVVSQAPYTRSVVLMAQEIAKRGVKVIAMTDSGLSPLARVAAVSLLFDTRSPSFFHSQVGALGLAEALMACVSDQSQDQASKRLAARQDMLQRLGAYWERPTPIPTRSAHASES